MAREIVRDAFWMQASDMPVTPTEALMRAKPFDEPDASYLELCGLATIVEGLEETLSHTERELLRMVVFEKLSFREIARQLDMSKSSAHRAWHALRANLVCKLLSVLATHDTEEDSVRRIQRAADGRPA